MEVVKAKSYLRGVNKGSISHELNGASFIGISGYATERGTLDENSQNTEALLSTNSDYMQKIEENYNLNGINTSRRFTWKDDFRGTKEIFSSWFYLMLLIIIPAALSGILQWNALIVFWLNFLALIPLASLLGKFTEELALHTGEIIGGFLNATFGNLIEMIIAVQALKANLVYVVQATLIGSILSNLLLVLGMSFLAGGIKHHVQKFNEKGASCSVSLLLISCFAIIIPTVTGGIVGKTSTYELLMVSRLTSIIVLITYCLFLIFQLHTHLSQFQNSQHSEVAFPCISKLVASVLLLLVTLLIASHSEFLVGSIEEMVQVYHFPESFIGIVLLPIVGNGAEHLTAITVALKNKVDLTMGVAVGSSVQIALFVVPFTVIASWILGASMTLVFPPLLASILIMSVLVTMAILQDGESNWLEGVLLITSYFIVGVIFWYYDDIVANNK